MISNLELARVMIAFIYCICLFGAGYVIIDFRAFMREMDTVKSFDQHVDDALLIANP